MKPSLALCWQTPPAWAVHALREPHALLSDHAHCELGAAAAAQGFVARAVADASLVERMAALAVEELRHFRQVHRLLRDLDGALEPVRRNAYVEGLMRGAREARPDPEEALLDRLLVAALVEARSLERFELLAASGSDIGTASEEPGIGNTAEPSSQLDRVRALYAELAPSEAGHARLFVELACERYPHGLVAARLERLAEHEGRLVRAQPFAARIHSGPPTSRETFEASGGRSRGGASEHVR